MNYNYNKNTNYFLKYLDTFDRNVKVIDINIFTIRHLLEEIKLEFTLNDNSYNDVNIKMLTDKISLLVHNNNIVNELDKKNLLFLMNNIKDKNSQNYICSLCDTLLKKYASKRFIQRIINNLINLLSDDIIDNSIEIKILTDYIMIEFRYFGYSYYETRNNIMRLVSKPTIVDNGKKSIVGVPYYFFNIKSNDIEEIYNIVNNMTIYEKLKHMSKFLSENKKNYYLIVALFGIKTDKKIICDKNITIYNPLVSKEINEVDSEFLSVERFIGCDYGTNNANAIVKVKAININEAISNGIKYLESYLNLYNILVKNSDIIILRMQKKVLDSNKKCIYSSISKTSTEIDKKNLNRKIHPITYDDINNNEKNIIEELLETLYSDKKKLTETDSRIINLLKKYNESLDCVGNQDKILKLWSCLESLFDKSITLDKIKYKSEIIVKVLSTFWVYSGRFDPVKKLGNELKKDSNLFADCYEENVSILLPIEEIESIIGKTNRYNMYSIKPLAKNCKKLLKYTDSYYYNQIINDVFKYYNDISYATDRNYKRIIENADIINNCYRLRNQIIHNADSNELTTEYYLEYLKMISNHFINYILEKYRDNKFKSISQIILDLYSEANMYLEQSKIEKVINLI